MSKLCWVEVQKEPPWHPIRIFRNSKDAVKAKINLDPVVRMDRSKAVGLIRDQVIKNADGDCQQCGKTVGTNGHMHEVIPRGKSGEVSIFNSILLCADCHIGDNSYSAHSDRRLGGKR